MDRVAYVDGLRRDEQKLRASLASLDRSRMGGRTRWGAELTDLTPSWRAELIRRIAELNQIASTIERGQMV